MPFFGRQSPQLYVIIIGPSRTAFNFNTNVWTEEQGRRPINLSTDGKEGGNAIADIIFGKASPSGRLPITFPKSLDQLPPYKDYSMQGRTYRYMTEEPLYAFGFGFSLYPLYTVT